MTPPLPPLGVALARFVGLPSGVAAEAARADQNARWAAGERVLAERYLAALPHVAASPEAALVLVYGEFLLRAELGQAVDPDVFLARFPQYRDALAAVFDVHRGLALTTPPSSVSLAGAPPAVPGYDRLELAGRGGMGVVYKARELATGRTVAVKVVRPGDGGSAALVRFLQEADVLARLGHPNVVRLLGRGATDDGPYLVTEWVAGGALADRLTGAPVAPNWAAELVHGVARGLGAAHAAGVIHRDVKPGNILLEGEAGAPGGSPRPVPKVTDFGLARLVGCGGTLTATDELIGTRRYMPPEQLDGRAREVGPWSDLFSLGAVLYELLTGRPAFPDRDTPAGSAAFAAPRPARAPALTIPPRLEAVCARALRPDPRDRFRSADAFATALGSY